MRQITFAGMVFLLIGCSNSVGKEDLRLLNGYWEITQVAFSDGSKKDYGLNTTVDYIELNDNKGFRKKVQPNLNGTFVTSDDAEFFTIIDTEIGLEFSYKNEMSEWNEQIIQVSKNRFTIENENGIRYTYQRYQPINVQK